MVTRKKASAPKGATRGVGLDRVPKATKTERAASKARAPKESQRAPVTIPEGKPSVDELIRRDAQEAQTVQPTAELIEYAQMVRKLEAEVAVLQEQEAEKKAEITRLLQRVLPPAMDTLQLKQFLLEDGTQVERSDEVYASISKDNALAAAAWLEKNGAGSIVKAKIVVEFERGDTALAKLVRQLLTKSRIAFEETAGVHNATLRAYVKESVEEGRKLPSCISYHVQPTAVLKVRKPRKSRTDASVAAPSGNNILR